MTHRTKCLMLLVVIAILWSTSGVIVKSVDWNPIAIASSRGLIAALTIFFLTSKRPGWGFPTKIQWMGSILVALVALFFVSATKLTTAANAILLQYTAPVWVAILAPFFLRERTSGRDCLFMALALAGMALFFKDSLSTEGFWGIILGILCGMTFAGMMMVIRLLKSGQSFTIMVYGNIMLFLGGLYFWQPPWPDAKGIAIILFAGLIQYGLSYYLLNLASEEASSLEMVLITALEPILNPIWVYLAVGEKPGHWALIGGAIVLTSITAWSVLKVARPSPHIETKPKSG